MPEAPGTRPAKDYRDPLYGFITVNELEQKIIETRCVQRLRYIRQLGTSFLVYPSAMHTRFEHALGVLFVVEKVLDQLFTDPGSMQTLGWSREQQHEGRQKLRLAALLHDVGHSPFSHASEHLFGKDQSGNQLEHEDYTYKLITETEVAPLLNQHFGPDGAEGIADMAAGDAKNEEEAFLSSLLTGDFGADRVDYLIRDSYHLGVEYGRFDVHRLLNTLFVRYNPEIPGPELYLEDGGIHTIEGFILARYFMFADVYFHKTRRIMDNHLSEFIFWCLGEKPYPIDAYEYMKWSDNRILFLLEEKRHTELAKRLLSRDHYRLAFETTDHPSIKEVEKFKLMEREIQRRFENVILDEAIKATYKFDKPEIFVFHRNKERFYSLSEASAVVGHLQPINKSRVYAPLEMRKSVSAFCNDYWEANEARGGE